MTAHTVEAEPVEPVEPVEAIEEWEPEAVGPDASIISELRAQRKQITSRKPTDILIPGYAGKLVMRCVLIDWSVMRKIAERADKSKHPKRELLAHADTIIASCQDIMFVKGDDEPQTIYPGAPLLFDDRLMSLLDLTVPTKSARSVLLATFDNDLAVSATYNELVEWMHETNPEADDELLGE